MSIRIMQEKVASAFAPVADEDGVLVRTPVLYPSNGNVVVHITGGADKCIVSDRGDALRNAHAHGVEIPNVDQWLNTIIKGSFLHASKGHITSGELQLKDVFAGIALVARAASTAVFYAVDRYKPETVTVHERAHQQLVGRFGLAHVSREAVAVGESTRSYHFDFAVRSIGPKPLLLDTVMPNPNSVNAKAIAHIDVAKLGDKAPLHAIIYDEGADWEAADINLLQSAAQLLPVSRLSTELGRYERLH